MHKPEHTVRKRRRALQSPKVVGILFVAPALAYMLAMIGYPIVYNLYLGFVNLDLSTFRARDFTFLGLGNYRELFSGALFPRVLLQTFEYTILSLLIQFALGFALALLFSKRFALAEPLRGLTLITWMMPLTVSALIWKFMMGTDLGILNHILQGIGLIQQPIEWLVSEKTALLSLVIANCWIGTPVVMIMLTTGLANIPGEVYESAAIDGAGRLQRLTRITLPMLRPTILSTLVLGFIGTFKVFDLVIVMTGGGPANATDMLSTYSYRFSFSQFKFSMGSAVANVLFACLLAVGLLYLQFSKKDEVA